MENYVRQHYPARHIIHYFFQSSSSCGDCNDVRWCCPNVTCGGEVISYHAIKLQSRRQTVTKGRISAGKEANVIQPLLSWKWPLHNLFKYLFPRFAFWEMPADLNCVSSFSSSTPPPPDHLLAFNGDFKIKHTEVHRTSAYIVLI